MRTEEAQAIAESFIAQTLGPEWTFIWDHRGQAIGYTVFDYKVIALSPVFVKDLTFDQVKDTILHEIAHAKAGKYAGHGAEWRMWAEKLGANPRATASVDLSADTMEEMGVKHVLVAADGEIAKGYKKHPGQKRQTLLEKAAYIVGKKAETIGTLKLISMAKYKQQYA